MMMDTRDLEDLPRTCRGGEHCCRPDQPCALTEGDCNTDQDCQAGVLISHWSSSDQAPALIGWIFLFASYHAIKNQLGHPKTKVH